MALVLIAHEKLGVDLILQSMQKDAVMQQLQMDLQKAEQNAMQWKDMAQAIHADQRNQGSAINELWGLCKTQSLEIRAKDRELENMRMYLQTLGLSMNEARNDSQPESCSAQKACSESAWQERDVACPENKGV